MKIIRSIGMIVVIVLTLHVIASSPIGFESKSQARSFSIEKTISSVSNQNILKHSEQLVKEKPIYSWSTIISLVVAVIGIVAFRRNSSS